MRVLQLRRRKGGRTITDPARLLRFSADGGILAACFDTSIGVSALDVHNGNPLLLPDEGRSRPTCMAFSSDGEYYAVGSADGVARAFRLRNGARLAELTVGGHGSYVLAVAFAPTDDPGRQWLAACGREFWLWNPQTQQYLVAPDTAAYTAAVFERDSRAVVAANYNEVIRFTLRPFTETWRFRTAGATLMFPQLLLPAPDGASIVVTTDGLTLFQLNVEDGAERSRTYLATRPRSAAFLPNSRLLAVADGSPTLRVYDTDTGTVAREYDWGIGGIHCVTFSHDGAMGAAGGGKGRVVVWDVE